MAIRPVPPADIFCVNLVKEIFTRKSRCLSKWLVSAHVKELTGRFAKVDGKFQMGKVTIKFTSGHTFTGNLGQDKRIGRIAKGSCSLTYPSGMRFEGNFENGYPSGKGKLSFPNGMNYFGSWHALEKRFVMKTTYHEYTSYIFEDGGKGRSTGCYVVELNILGEFDPSGRLLGEATIQTQTGVGLRGYFSQDTLIGTFTYSENAIYNKFEGTMRSAFHDSKSLYGCDFWENSLVQGVVTFRHGWYGLSDEAVYEGGFDGQFPHGVGKAISDGIAYRVLYDHGNLIQQTRENPPPPPPLPQINQEKENQAKELKSAQDAKIEAEKKVKELQEQLAKAPAQPPAAVKRPLPAATKSPAVTRTASAQRLGETITLPDGSSYTGLTKEGKPHGKGVQIFTGHTQFKKFDGEFSEGQFVNGTITFIDGSSYVGDVNNPKGKGILNTIEGESINGNFEDGQFKEQK